MTVCATTSTRQQDAGSGVTCVQVSIMFLSQCFEACNPKFSKIHEALCNVLT